MSAEILLSSHAVKQGWKPLPVQEVLSTSTSPLIPCVLRLVKRKLQVQRSHEINGIIYDSLSAKTYSFGSTYSTSSFQIPHRLTRLSTYALLTRDSHITHIPFLHWVSQCVVSTYSRSISCLGLPLTLSSCVPTR